jgi:phthalate 4,5-cis-dihydrodiol dehydrogenase
MAMNVTHAMGDGGARMHTTRDGGDIFRPELGLTIVSCERGHMPLVSDGLIIYDDAGKRVVPLPRGRGAPGRGEGIDELSEAVAHARPLVHHRHWGRAALEVCLALPQSARERREITLSQQCPVHDEEGKPLGIRQ